VLRISVEENLAFDRCKDFEFVESSPAQHPSFQSCSVVVAAAADVDFLSAVYSSGVIPDADPLRTTAGCDRASWEPIVDGNPTAATC
jgi:hypothetical protein